RNKLIDVRLAEPDLALNRHANGVDWWIISPLQDTNQYSVYLVDSSGASLHSIQEIGNPDDGKDRSSGQSVFTPFGDKYLRYTSQKGLQIFDFDRTTGQLSNFQFVYLPFSDRPEDPIAGLGISPSGQFAYVSTVHTIYQYDLWAGEAIDIERSRIQVGEVGNPDSLWIGIAPTARNFQLGPDCKLYSYANTGKKHHVIHYPDRLGIACEWEQGALELPISTFRDQPAFPHFRLGPLGEEGSPCANPIVSIRDIAEDSPTYLSVFPNPTNGPLSLSLSGNLGPEGGWWTLFDARGRQVRQHNLRSGGVTGITREGLPGGMYFWQLTAGGKLLETGKVIYE
ncbi:MAG: T9SS type A sorting domain-containing protein, partial [Bacteroidota bacterium]